MRYRRCCSLHSLTTFGWFLFLLTPESRGPALNVRNLPPIILFSRPCPLPFRSLWLPLTHIHTHTTHIPSLTHSFTVSPSYHSSYLSLNLFSTTGQTVPLTFIIRPLRLSRLYSYDSHARYDTYRYDPSSFLTYCYYVTTISYTSEALPLPPRILPRDRCTALGHWSATCVPDEQMEPATQE